MPPELDKETQKAAMKEAISEWLDTQFMIVGRWTAKGIISIALAGLLYAYMSTHGFKI